MQFRNSPPVRWKQLASSPRIVGALVFCLGSLLLVLFYLPVFYESVIGPKPGSNLNDLLFRVLEPVDLSIPIFTLIYLTILHTLVTLLGKPLDFVVALTAYFGITLLRMLAMYLLTLEPPADMIRLVDPVTAHFYPSGGFAKDLFFSGHVSTMTLMVLAETRKGIRWIKAGATVLVGFFLIWQHVHYSLDVFVAPPVAALVFFIVKRFLTRSEKA